jgi:hypothetical protein
MNERSSIDFRTVVFVIFIAAAFVALPWVIYRQHHRMTRHNMPEPIGYARMQERIKAFEDVRSNSVPLLEKYDWRNKDAGIVRIPIERAKELAAQEWQNPAAAHKELNARAAKAFAPPPAKPQKPSEYE